jgi:glucose-6-phosphate 1-dehydrogenase
MVTMSGSQVDALVIFGATGDLAKLETFPALVGLVERGVLDVPVIGVAKAGGWGVEQFRDYASASLTLNKMDPASPAATKMLSLLRYVDGDLGDHSTYEAMSSVLGDAKRVLYYLEVPPFLFGRITEGISAAGRAAGNRVMVEKPFGYDEASASALNDQMHQYFPEESIYRVDHWLGLDPVESLMFARFANSIIEPLLNRTYVQSIQITMAEAFDVSDRGSFYDKTGAIKDVIQNHMLQVLATVLADPPNGAGLDSWISAKASVIGALRPLGPSDVVKGQYNGYLDVTGVAAGSQTETYAAVRLHADSWRWEGVPLLIRAGKCLPVTATEVSVKFRQPPHDAFGLGTGASSNGLRFRIYPESKAVLTLVGKRPGAGWDPEVQDLTFTQHPGADMRPYDRLIGAALNGERWLFAQQDTVEASWRVVDPVLSSSASAAAIPVVRYDQGTWGADSTALLPPGESWYDPAAE